MQAFPMLYNSRVMGCMIPERSYGGHMPPMPDSDIVLMLMDSAHSFS